MRSMWNVYAISMLVFMNIHTAAACVGGYDGG